MSLFSTRNKPKPAEYSYEIPQQVRNRFMFTVNELVAQMIGMQTVLAEIQAILLKRFGGLKGTKRNYGQTIGEPVVDHINTCSDEEFLDVIELVFRVSGHGAFKHGVAECNLIFEQENIGYELTPFVISERPLPPGRRVQAIFGPTAEIAQYPQVIRKSEKALHAGTIEPALQVLSDPRFATANGELVDGLVKLRKGQYQESIQACGSAIETVLKTICTLKRWPYIEHKDNLSDLTLICQSKGLFFLFYKNILDGTGTMRNRMSAHGKGPKPEYIPTKEHAEHMAYTCCANAVFLISQANL